MTPPSFTLADLLSGDHNDVLRELAAKNIGYRVIDIHRMMEQWVRPDGTYINQSCVPIPEFHTSLDSCRELLEALTDEEFGWMDLNLSELFSKQGKDEYTWNASALEILIAFCLTRNLIQLVEQ